mmetsp:Transcript_32373/g.76862  ORF Transcript_32373/g.76862 Transcript_32373/m.76862 type:complete len:260 (-) Transcript_32373:354-1133(-)
MAPQCLFLGDSHTQGDLGHDWVRDIGNILPDVELLNHGVNGDLSMNVCKRLDAIYETLSDLDVAVLLVGTNDVLSQHFTLFRWIYFWGKGLRKGSSSLEAYTENVGSAIASLSSKSKLVVVLTIPPIGENLKSDMNQTVCKYNSVLTQVATGHDNVRLLDFYEACVQYFASEETSVPATQPWSSFQLLSRMLVCSWRHNFGQSWDALSHLLGNRLLTDYVHLNDTAASLLVNMLVPCLRDVLLQSDNSVELFSTMPHGV